MNSVDACFIARDEYTTPLNMEQKALNNKYNFEVHYKIRVNNKKWCLTIVPTQKDAMLKGISYNEMLEIYLNACAIDYSKLNNAMDPLVKYIQNADKVHILGKGTDLKFSIKGLPEPVRCIGKRNLPDGEVYTAPVRDSVNGIIQFNTSSIYNGVLFNDILLEFKDGKAIRAESNDTKRLNEILDADEGCRYIGEFAFGLNPLIKNAQNSALYDEKIGGSLHCALGDSLAKCSNGNRAPMHWDIVQIQTPEYGGGEIWFDNKLIRKDGLFVPGDLQVLNPDNLLRDQGMDQ